MKKTYKLTLTAMFIAIGTVSSSLVAIPIGFSKGIPKYKKTEVQFSFAPLFRDL
ncbi:hypothetical protein [Neobacillus paridis]|uniref:hypothetical protein n=1 Tax=Neobacillus paridis TaxID=2803862 RepID=UPI001F215D79|nr:hypothetical protein [Neobacillus paridis]